MRRPLDRLHSIKLKISIVIIVAVGITAVVSTIGFRTGIPLWLRPIIAATIALLLVYPFSRGLTSPLREMAAASKAMARGDYDHPVEATSRDEVGELARAFNAMRAQLAEIDRQRRDLVANVSHELRTPLSAMRARLENIVDGVEPADPDNIRSALVEIERLSGLIDQLLELSRLESGVTSLAVESFELGPVIEQVVDSARHENVAVEVTVSPDDPLRYQGDQVRVGQVVTNLVQNAARYATAATPIDVRARSLPHGVELVVSDHGPGIPPEERSRVFERFYRSDHGRASDSGGTGLGLAIVRGIVDLHGGDIEIRSNDPTGCRVVVSLPHVTEVSR